MGWGRGRGFGRGRGWGRRGYYPEPDPYYGPRPFYGPSSGDMYTEPDPKEEKAYLENVVKSLERELKAVQDRIKKLSETKQD